MSLKSVFCFFSLEIGLSIGVYILQDAILFFACQ